MLAQLSFQDQKFCSIKIPGELAPKTVPLKNVADFLANLLTVDESSWLPPNLVYLRRDGGNVGAVYYFPEQRKIYHWNGDKYDILIPESLLFFKLTALKNDQYKIIKMAGAFMESYQLGGSNLFVWPFPNTEYGYSPGFCWGSDRVAKDMYEKACTLDQLPILYNRFFAAEANNDLGWKMNKEGTSALRAMNVKEYSPKAMKDLFSSTTTSRIGSALGFDFTR